MPKTTAFNGIKIDRTLYKSIEYQINRTLFDVNILLFCILSQILNNYCIGDITSRLNLVKATEYVIQLKIKMYFRLNLKNNFQLSDNLIPSEL